MKRRHLNPYPTLLILSLVAILSCGSNGDAGDDVPVTGDTPNGGDATNAEVYSPNSYYSLTITLPHGDEMVFDRDLTGDTTAFSFGSTHYPAGVIGLAINDIMYNPDYAEMELNFGIIQGSPEYPVQTPGPAKYSFSADPPAFKFAIDNVTYRSTVEGSHGKIIVANWGNTPGQIFSGSVEGTLVQDTTNELKEELEISGSFYFTLPPTQ